MFLDFFELDQPSSAVGCTHQKKIIITMTQRLAEGQGGGVLLFGSRNWTFLHLAVARTGHAFMVLLEL